MKKNNVVIIFLIITMLCGCEKQGANNPDVVLPNVSEESTFVSPEKAQAVASKFAMSNLPDLIANTKSGDLAIEEIKEIKDAEGQSMMYVVNFNPEGFVIVGASKDYYPILAYSDQCSYSFDEDSPANIYWLGETKNAVAESANLPDSVKNAIKYLWLDYSNKAIKPNITTELTRAADIDNPMEAQFQARIAELQEELGEGVTFYRLSDIDMSEFPDTQGAYLHYCQMAQEAGSPLQYTIIAIFGGHVEKKNGPLVSTQWHNNGNFNFLCDCYPDAVGCATVAIAQLIKFHRFPNLYNWSGMHNTIASEPTQILFRDVHDCIGLSPSESDIKSVLEEDFGYTVNMQNHNMISVYNEIINRSRPVLMTGLKNNSNKGHAWICSGAWMEYDMSGYFIEFYINGDYTSLEYAPSIDDYVSVIPQKTYYFHQNWGWGTSSTNTQNGWFISDNVSTTQGNFSSNRKDFFVTK